MDGFLYPSRHSPLGAEESAFPLYVPSICEQWGELIHLGTKRKYDKNELIVRGDTPCDEFMYVYSGLVRCEHPGVRGKLKICFYAGRGAIFAEALAFHQKPTVASFVAAEDSVIYSFPLKVITDVVLVSYPEMAFKLMELMAYKIRLYSLHLESITLDDVSAQICRICYSILSEAGSLECSPGVNQQELADILGVHRNTIVRAIYRLKKENVIVKLSNSVLKVNSLKVLLERGTAYGDDKYA